MHPHNLSERIQLIQQRIENAANSVHRDPAAVRLMGASKTQPPEVIDTAVRAGLRLFGENKIQEARAKIPLTSSAADWHFIGHLQTNKAKDAVALFSCVHAVDSVPLASEINSQCEKQDKRLDILLEVNVSGEGSKFGIKPALLPGLMESVLHLSRLRLVGLMTLAPYADDPEKARPYFEQLRLLRDETEQRSGLKLPELSMGMSGDFEQAIMEGSTLVRIGSALFGERRSVLSRPPAEEMG